MKILLIRDPNFIILTHNGKYKNTIFKTFLFINPTIRDPQKIHKDCLSRLQTTRLKDNRKRIMEEMIAAEAAGDQEKLDLLREEFNQTIKSKMVDKK